MIALELTAENISWEWKYAAVIKCCICAICAQMFIVKFY